MKYYIAVFSLLVQFARADCGPQWLFNDGLRGTEGEVYCSCLWDPDGPGPRTPVLVIGGKFSVAGNQRASNIVTWDPGTSEWTPLGAGTDDAVYALAANNQGELFAGGSFLHAGGLSLPGIARWNGMAWTGLSSGMGGVEPIVHALATGPGGELYAGGQFEAAGGVPVKNVASWSGGAWHAMGSGLGGDVLTLVVMPNGDLMAGGSFSRNGDNVLVRNLARWNGVSWNALSAGGLNGTIRKMALHPSGKLIVIGDFLFTPGGTANRIAAWNGTSWEVFGTGFTGGFSQLGNTPFVRSLVVLANGDIVAGGSFYVPGNPVLNSLYRWNGSSWEIYGGIIGSSRDRGQVLTLTELLDGSLFAGGQFTLADGSSCLHMARLQGSVWTHLGQGMDLPVLSLLSLPNGEVIAGGYFGAAGEALASLIARWDGRDWHPFASGMTESGRNFVPAVVKALCRMPNGDVIAGGEFLMAGGTPVKSLARWSGMQWNDIGGGLSGTIFTNQGTWADALAVLPNGDLVVGGQFNTAGSTPAMGLARFDGTQWHTLSGGTPDGLVMALAVLPNGDLIAGGEFLNVGGLAVKRIARWDGNAWSPLGSGALGDPAFVAALAVSSDGQLFAGGRFSAGGTRSIARWDGVNWRAMGFGLDEYDSVGAIAVMPNGDVVIAGDFDQVDKKPMSNIARWNGSTWNPMQAGIGGKVSALTVRANGELVAGGDFVRAGSHSAGYWARWSESGAPTTAFGPTNVASDAGQTVTLSAAPEDGYESTSYRWMRNGIPIVDGPHGAGSRGGSVSGAAGSFSSPTLDSVATLSISNVRPSDAGQFTAEFQNACGTAVTVAATLSVVDHCPADLNGDGHIGDADFCLFACDYNIMICADAGMPEYCPSDFNRDGQVDDSDFVTFLSAYSIMICGNAAE